LLPAFKQHFSFPDQYQSQVGQLNQVAARSHPAMFIYTGNDVFIDQDGQQLHQLRVDTRISLHQAIEPCHHYRLAQHRTKYLTPAGTVAADKIVLELQHVFRTHLKLGHRAKSCIDTVDQLVTRKPTQK